MKNNFITEISLEDFKKLNLIGYRNTKVYFNEKGFETIEEKSNSYKFLMRPLSINDELDKNIKYCKENNWNKIAIAIHVEPSEEEIEEGMKSFTFDTKTCKRRNLNRDEAYEFALLDASYLDKFMNRFSGHQTFQIGCGIDHIYSNRDYWYATEDYWKVKKKETKAIYLIHLE